MQINIKASWQAAKNGFNQVLNHAKGIGSGLNNAFDKVKGVLGSVAGMLGMGLGTAAAVRGVKNLIDKMDYIEDTAPKIGVSFGYFQKMQFAAERSGTSFDAVVSSFTRMKKAAGDAAAGQRKAVDTFAMLGISVDQLKGMNPEELFDEVAARLNLMEDPLLRDAAAAALFGRNFTELNNYLDQYIERGQELEALGGVIDDETVLAAAVFNDHIANLAVQLQALTVNTGLLTSITEAVEGLEAMVSLTKKMNKQGITSEQAKYDEQEGTLAKWTRRALNVASFSPLAQVMGKDQFKLGDKLFGRPEERMMTEAITKDQVQAALAKHDLKEERKKQVDVASKHEAAKKHAAVEEARNKEEERLKKAQEALKKKEAKAGKPKTAESVDRLHKVGGYTGAAGAMVDKTTQFAKKQTDLLTSVDAKLAVLETAVRDGGMLFP